MPFLSPNHQRQSTVKRCFHYGCAALRVASDSERLCSDMSRFIARRYYRGDSKNTNFQLIQWEPFPLELRCGALRVAIDIETPIVFLYLSQCAAQRSRSGNRP